MPSEGQKQLLGELEGDLKDLQQHTQLRQFAEIAGVNFCSNDYLGLAEDPRLKAAVLESVKAAGRVGGTGSRLLSGHHDQWNELEEEFAAFAGTSAALYFANGYAANLGLLTSLLGKGDLVYSDERNHSSLIDGIRLSGARKVIFPHLDLNALERELRAHVNQRCRRLIVTESVFSMDGDLADVKTLQQLGERFGASLVVDEAHATAVHGPGGRGLVAQARLTGEVLATVHTCGKALASAGAFVCGPRVLREFLINHARTLIFSTALPPYMAGQIRAALQLAEAADVEREQLLDRSMLLASALGSQGWGVPEGHSQIIPVLLGSNEEAVSAAAFLQQQGFAVRAIRPPTVPAGSARLRLSLTTRVSNEHLLGIVPVLNAWRASQKTFSMAGAMGHA